MADPDTNIEMIRQCMKRSNALELTARSIIDNTKFDSETQKAFFHAKLRDTATHMIALLSWLEERNTKA